MKPPLLYLLIISDTHAGHTNVLFSLCHKEFVCDVKIVSVCAT